MHKIERHNLIKNLVRSHRLATQEGLQGLLAKQGVQVTQATLSRDIQEIPLIKRSGLYCYGAITLDDNKVHQILSVKIAPPNILIVQTSSGSAQSIAVLIDQQKIPGVAGSVAGDDTIFVAIEKQQIASVKTALTKIFNKAAQ